MVEPFSMEDPLAGAQWIIGRVAEPRQDVIGRIITSNAAFGTRATEKHHM